MNVEINWQDADSSSSNAVKAMFPNATIMTCGGHAARSHLKQLETLSGRKEFAKALQDRHKKAYPDVETVRCHCRENHSPGCGCMSKTFMEQSRNNFSQILSESQSAPEFARRLHSLPHHMCNEHKWDGGECEFHTPTVCSCGKCTDRSKHECNGKPYQTRNRLTCPFHSLAYKIEIEDRASMADNLVHPLLKRGHSNLPEASHNVLIRFRSKHIFLERLHYNLSTDLGLLQSNMTYERKTKGKDYCHWTTKLYRRLNLPIYEGVEEALEKYAVTREKSLERGKEEKTKRRRIALKIARKKEQEVRKLWSKRHGGDTYGDSDSEVKNEEQKQCKACGSFTHTRKTSKDCPYNKNRKDIPRNTANSESDQPLSDSNIDPYLSEGRYSDGRNTTEESSSDEDLGNQTVTETQCTCNTLSRAHKSQCPLNFRNRYKSNTIITVEDDKQDLALPDVWIRNSLYTLSNKDRETIQKPNGWLSDSVVSAGQSLLKQHFPNIAGLQPPVLQQRRVFNVHSNDFVQIINVENIHWCVVSNVGCQKGIVNVYDSLNWRLKDSSTPIIASLVSRQSITKLKINTIEVQKQANGANCGVHAIAIAYDLCAGLDPAKAEYNHKEIRRHLLQCLTEGSITRFPTRGERMSSGIVSSTDVELHCTCRMPEEEYVPMARCDKCNVWYHKECMDIPNDVLFAQEEIYWECKSCKPNCH